MISKDYNHIIADASCFILLNKIGELEILHKVFGQIITTSFIKTEFGGELPGWIIIKDPKDKKYQQLLETDVDKGEASGMALALELENALLVVDDLKARKLSEKPGIDYTGTFGIILYARKTGVIVSVTPILHKIRQTNFRLSDSLVNEILKMAGETE